MTEYNGASHPLESKLRTEINQLTADFAAEAMEILESQRREILELRVKLQARKLDNNCDTNSNDSMVSKIGL